MPAEPHPATGPDPDAVASQTFTRTRKGYEVDEVRAYLVGLASQVREAQRRQADQGRRLAELERRATDPQDLDEDQVTQRLGEETARLLQTARSAATEIRAKADEHAALVTDAADAQATESREAAAAYDTETRAAADQYAAATRSTADADVDALRASVGAEVEGLREEAERVLSERTAEAESAADAIRAEADAHRDEVRSHADAYAVETRDAADAYRDQTRAAADSYRTAAEAEADQARADALAAAETSRTEGATAAEQSRAGAEREAEAIREVARQEGRTMVEEAREYRERVIADLADRRRSARAELSRLAASRDALAVTLTDVATRIEASHHALAGAVIDPADLGDVATDRAALSDPEPVPDLPADPPDAPTSPDEADDDEPEPDPSPDVADVMPEGEAHPSPDVADVLPEDTPAASADVEDVLPEDTPATSADVEDVLPEDVEPEPGPAETGGEVTGDRVGAPTGEDPAAAVFARLKAADSGTAVADLPPTGGEEPAPADDTDLASAAHADGAQDDDAEADGGTDEPGPDGADADGDLLDRRDATVDELERRLARRLKRVLSDEQNEALDRLRRVKGQARAGDVLVGQDEHQDRYRSAALEDLTAAERAGAAFFADEDPSASPADVTDVADLFAADLVRALRGRLETAIDDGGDEAEIGERIRACYREWKTQRIAEVATHYVLVAFGRGVGQGAAHAATPARWLVDDGGAPCPDCDDNALAGAVPPGEEFPTGHVHPPAHPGCRCLAVPAS